MAQYEVHVTLQIDAANREEAAAFASQAMQEWTEDYESDLPQDPRVVGYDIAWQVNHVVE